MIELPSHWNLTIKDTAVSTMDECRQILQSEKTALAIARTQSGGKGRRGNQWISPRGGFYATYGWILPKPLKLWSGLSLAVGVSLLDALELESHGVRLKWPNDLVHPGSGRKLGGVLIELFEKEGMSAVLVGVGINCRKASYEGAVSLEELCGQVPTIESVAQAVSSKLDDDVTLFSRIGFGGFQERWLELSAHEGRGLAIEKEKATIRGRFAGIEEDGTLLLETPAGIERVQSGHIVEW